MDIWKRAQIGAQWMRDSFASWFATSWLYLILWGVVGIAFTVLLYIDGVFSRSLAPDSINPLSFQAMGWAYRFFAAAFLMAAARCAFKGIEGKWTFRLLGIFASVIVCLHAFGFGFEALSDKRDNAEITVAVQDNLEGGVQARIDQYNTQIEGIRNDRDAAIETAQAGIDSIKDEVPGLSADDNASIRAFQEDKTDAQKTAADKIAEIEGKIESLLAPPSSEDAVELAEAKANAEYVEKWHPLFVGLAQLANGTWDPVDNEIYVAAIVFIIFWVLLAESLVIFLPERIYVMHLHDAERARVSSRAEKGWETRRKNEESERDQLQIADAGFWSLKIIKALNNNMPRRTVKGMCRTFFSNMEPGAVRVKLERFMDARMELPKGFYQDGKGDVKRADKAIERGFLSEERQTYLMQEHIDYILLQGEYAPKKKADEEPKPKQAENGKDHSTELTLPELGADDESNRPEA